MVASAVEVETQNSAMARLTELLDRPDFGRLPDDVIVELSNVVRAVLHENQANKIRVAVQLACAKSRDVMEVGCSGWEAFVLEHSLWGLSQTRAYLKLVESRLDVVKEAASRNVITLTMAASAPKQLGSEATPSEQLEWIRAALFLAPRRHSGVDTVALTGSEMRTVLEARELAATLLGGGAPKPVVDRFLFDCHRERRTRDRIVGGALEPPAIPERLGQPVPEWGEDPAASALGPWVEPATLRELVDRLRVNVLNCTRRRVLLGIALFLVRYHALWTVFPQCDSLDDFCLDLGISRRSLRRYCHEGLLFLNAPTVRAEVEQGRLTFDRAMFVMENANGSDSSIRGWIDLARRLGRAELRHAREVEIDQNLRQEYAPAVVMAEQVEVALLRRVADPTEGERPAIGGTSDEEASDEEPSPGGPLGGRPTIGATPQRIARYLRSLGATAPIQVALRDASRSRSKPEPTSIEVPSWMLEAARYLLRVVDLPPVYGPRKMVAKERYTCQNPRCRRRTLRVHPHHLHQRQHGGTDEPRNILPLCPPCHLRGVHGGHMDVVRIEEWIVFTYVAGPPVLMFSPVADLAYEPRRSMAAA